MSATEVAVGAFEGRTAVVTGASRGIGRTIAEHLLAAGANVVITGRKQASLDQVAAELSPAHGEDRILPFAAHAAEEDEARACMAEACARFGAVDVLVNNAATNPFMGQLVDIDHARAVKTHDVNLYGPLLWTQAAWRACMGERGGSVVNVSSIGGVRVDPSIGYYNVTKAALNHLTAQLAYELAPKVRVNVVLPSLIKTELARAVLFLAGDESSWITGQSLVVDGGILALPIDTDDGRSA